MRWHLMTTWIHLHVEYKIRVRLLAEYQPIIIALVSAADVCSSSITIIISCTTMTDDTRPYVICIEWSLVLAQNHLKLFFPDGYSLSQNGSSSCSSGSSEWSDLKMNENPRENSLVSAAAAWWWLEHVGRYIGDHHTVNVVWNEDTLPGLIIYK